MVSYILERDSAGRARCFVETQGERLGPNMRVELSPEPSQKLYNHSPDGFEWGYEGSGPAQLALAIMADHFMREGILPTLATQFYQQFKRKHIAVVPKVGGIITDEDISDFVDVFIP